MAASMRTACQRYLLLFAHEHLEFRLPEVQSLATLFGIKFNIPDGGYSEHLPYLIIDVDAGTNIRSIMSRTGLVKSLYELWGKGSNYEELEKDLHSYPYEKKIPHLSENKSICMRLETFNKVLPFPEKLERIETVLNMESFPFRGTVNLKQPDELFQLLENYGRQNTDPPAEPEYVYLGRWIADGQRDMMHKYNLQKRKYIGNTSMDPGLSFIMANMGIVKPNDIVYDPFVGTGSLLVACAHFGAYVTGTDIDYLLLMGRGKASKAGQKWRNRETDNIEANLRQYGLQARYLDALVADSSLHQMWRSDVQFDAIITDPPYGVRESTERLGTKKSEASDIPEHLKDAHIPARTHYHISDVMRDLLTFAAKHLRLNGRLVYWLPVYRPEYSESQVPRHPCLQLIANSEQGLTRRIGRRLITMEKIREPEPDDNLDHHQNEDHYKAASFREMYFRPPDWAKRKQQNDQLAARSAEGHLKDEESLETSTLINTMNVLCLNEESPTNEDKEADRKDSNESNR